MAPCASSQDGRPTRLTIPDRHRRVQPPRHLASERCQSPAGLARNRVESERTRTSRARYSFLNISVTASQRHCVDHRLPEIARRERATRLTCRSIIRPRRKRPPGAQVRLSRLSSRA